MTTSVSRNARVSSRSVALFVNAELRAGACVTGSSQKAPWGFMVPFQLGSEERREGGMETERERDRGGERGRERGEDRERE